MISTTLSADDLFYLRLEIPGVLEGAPVPPGVIVTARFAPIEGSDRGSLVFELGNGQVLEPMYDSLPMVGEALTEQFDLAHLLERLDFAQHQTPQPRKATMRLEKDDDSPLWYLVPVGEDTDLEAFIVYPASRADVPVVAWNSWENTAGWIPKASNHVVFEFASTFADALASLPEGENVTLVMDVGDSMRISSPTGDAVTPPVRTGGEPTQVVFSWNEINWNLEALRERYDLGAAQLGMYWSRFSDREWKLTARWADHIEVRRVSPVSVSDPLPVAGFCSDCGAQLAAEARFCSTCGTARAA